METIFWLLYAVIAIGVFGFIGASILRASRVVASWTNSRHQREIPELIPSGIALSDCLLGATAILTHVLAKHGVRAVDTAFVRYQAQLVLAARGLAPTWEQYIASVSDEESRGVWNEIRDRLGIPAPTRHPFGSNPALTGAGMLRIASSTNAHALVYAHGMVSDPSRPAGTPSWERLETVLNRYPGLVPQVLTSVPA